MTDSKTKFKELETIVTDIVKSVEFSSKSCEDKNTAQIVALNAANEELEGNAKAFIQEKYVASKICFSMALQKNPVSTLRTSSKPYSLMI